MALYQLLCGWTVMIILSNKGCHAMLPECGVAVRNSRIVGGQDASPGSWPWQVSLNDDGRPFCSGSLITNNWVMTAAHCLTGQSNLRVYLGRRSQSGQNPHEVSRQIDEIITHHSFDFLTYENDIALMRLSAPVNFTDYIYPICLAAAGSTFHTRTSSWVAGWGATANNPSSNILQEVNVPIVGNNECRCAHPGLTENMICAGHRDGGRDACQGDSGAPLVTKNGSVWVQGGLVSFGEGCAHPMIPGVYTRVSNYQDWISNITGNSQPGFVNFTSSGVDSDINFTCPTSLPSTTTYFTTPPTTIITCEDGKSIFDSGENVMHFYQFNHFISLCVLLLSFYVLFGDA